MRSDSKDKNTENDYKQLIEIATQKAANEISKRYKSNFKVLRSCADVGNLCYCVYLQPEIDKELVFSCTISQDGQVSDDYSYRVAMKYIGNLITDMLKAKKISSVLSVQTERTIFNHDSNLPSIQEFLNENRIDGIFVSLSILSDEIDKNAVRDMIDESLRSLSIKKVVACYMFRERDFRALDNLYHKGVTITCHDMERANPIGHFTLVI